MGISIQQFLNTYNNKYVQWRECVALFWQFNEDVMSSENYAAPGAIDLFTGNNWSTYTKTTAGARFGDWTIWSGSFGAYTNGGWGHVAMFIKDNGNGTGQFFSQNPNPAQIITLSYNGIVGHLRPRLSAVTPVSDNVKPILAKNERIVGNANLNQRAKANTNSKVVRLIQANTVEKFTGYVKGESVAGNDIWFKDAKGYAWSGGFKDSSTKGLKNLTPVSLKDHQRRVGNANVNQRNHAKTDSKVIRVINANTIENFTGYVRGENISGNNVWFADTEGYAWSGAFDDSSTKGLKDLTPKQLASNERLVGGANVNHRIEANTASDVVRLVKANTVEVFTGYVHGESIDGNDVWFADAKGFAWSGAFVDSSTSGLDDITPTEKPAPAPAPSNELPSNHRKVGDVATNQRVQPTTASIVLRVIEPNTVEIFIGFVHGQSVDGNDIWFKDDKGFAWSGGFLDPSTNGLPDLTNSLEELPPIDGAYSFTPDFDFVEYKPADTTNMQHGHFPAKPTHVVLHQFDAKAKNPSIEGVISHFQRVRPGNESSAHFAVSGTRIVQMVSLNDRAFHAGTVGNAYIGIEIDPQEDAETVTSVRKLLVAIKNKLGYLPTYTEHQDVPGNATACGIDIHLEKYTLAKEPETILVAPNNPVWTDATCENKTGTLTVPKQPEGVVATEPTWYSGGSWSVTFNTQKGYTFVDGKTELTWSYVPTPPVGCEDEEVVPVGPTPEELINEIDGLLQILKKKV